MVASIPGKMEWRSHDDSRQQGGPRHCADIRCLRKLGLWCILWREVVHAAVVHQVPELPHHDERLALIVVAAIIWQEEFSEEFRLVERVRAALTTAGVDGDPFSGHSFRSGAATTAASRGINDATIKMLGRWKSEVYQLYIKTTREQLAAVTKRLLHKDQPLHNKVKA